VSRDGQPPIRAVGCVVRRVSFRLALRQHELMIALFASVDVRQEVLAQRCAFVVPQLTFNE